MRKRHWVVILILIIGIIYRRKYMPHNTLWAPTEETGDTTNHSIVDALLQTEDTGGTQVSGSDITLSSDATAGNSYQGGGAYAPFSQTAVDVALAAGKRVILVFERTGDPTASALHDDIITHQDRIPKDTVIFFVNIDTESSLASQLSVENANTIIYFGSKGQEIRRSGNGVISLSQIVKGIDGINK